MDSREMLRLSDKLEVTFETNRSLDDTDLMLNEGKILTIQDIENYIERK